MGYVEWDFLCGEGFGNLRSVWSCDVVVIIVDEFIIDLEGLV